MDRKTARITAATRGSPSITSWMKENRKAARNFASRMHQRGEDRGRLQCLINTLDREYQQFNPLK